MHIAIVAGIIVVAVGDELVLAHPTGHADTKMVAAVIGGPLLYLLGNFLFKSTVAEHRPLSHLVGLMLYVLLLPFASHFTPLVLGAAASGVLVIVAVWETVSLRPYRSHPST
jgi:low temperature requirement protein LtrA